MNNDSSHDEHFNLKLLITIAIVLIVVAFLSLAFSYIWFSSEIWKAVYTPYGWLTELYRLWILIGVSIYLLIGPFQYEFIEIISFKTKKYKPLPLCRNIALALATIGLIVLLGYHFDIGPKDFETGPKYLVNICSETSEQLKELKLDPQSISETCEPITNQIIKPGDRKYWESFYRPYIFYLPYSIINFIVILIPLFVIVFYSSIKYFKKLNSLTNDLDEGIRLHHTFMKENFPERHVGSYSQKLLNKCKVISRRINIDFEEFCLNFLTIIGRYAAIFVSASILLFFEYYFGQYTLAQPARKWAYLAYFLFFILVVLIVCGYLYYEKAYKKNVDILHETTQYLGAADREILFEKFENDYTVLKFGERVFRRHVGLWIAIALLIPVITINPVVSEIVEFWKDLIS
jgi:ABC-type multidrug transport system fused ATPase/permease subunit